LGPRLHSHDRHADGEPGQPPHHMCHGLQPTRMATRCMALPP
jgi:hypothetical protein